jgi:hypothetical protein
VRKWEAELGLEELFDVRPPDILRLFDLHDSKNLQGNTINACTGGKPPAPEAEEKVRT